MHKGGKILLWPDSYNVSGSKSTPTPLWGNNLDHVLKGDMGIEVKNLLSFLQWSLCELGENLLLDEEKKDSKRSPGLFLSPFMVSGGRVQKLFNIIFSEPRAFPTNFVKLELNVRVSDKQRSRCLHITSSVTYAPHPVQPGGGGLQPTPKHRQRGHTECNFTWLD